MTTTVCALVALLVFLAAGGGAAREPQLFGRLLHFSAFVSAVVSLVLLGVVLKLRSEPPPAAVTWFAVAVALATIATTFLY